MVASLPFFKAAENYGNRADAVLLAHLIRELKNRPPPRTRNLPQYPCGLSSCRRWGYAFYGLPELSFLGVRKVGKPVGLQGHVTLFWLPLSAISNNRQSAAKLGPERLPAVSQGAFLWLALSPYQLGHSVCSVKGLGCLQRTAHDPQRFGQV